MTQPRRQQGEQPLLRADGLSKTFGATVALKAVNLEIVPGEVHALVGQNGSGKSTLIKILSGYHGPDSGSVQVRGEELRLPSRPRDVARRGLAFLHQDAPVAQAMTVLENIRVGRFSGHAVGRIRWRKERHDVRRLLESVGLNVDCNTLASALPQAERALVGFATAIQSLPREGGLLVLDEPTACLPPSGAKLLFDAIHALTQRGSSVLFVSHRLDEIMTISNRISVLREGQVVAVRDTARTSEDEIVTLMLGGKLEALYPVKRSTPKAEALRAESVTGRIVTDVSLELRQGEVVGVTGLIGMGQDELPYLLYGSVPLRSGHVEVHGNSLRRLRPHELRANGVALLPVDRAGSSGVLAISVKENLTLPVVTQFWRHGLLRNRAESASVQSVLHDYDVRPPTGSNRLGSLSGGNQQKVLLAKWLNSDPKILLLHEPTQGVDISSRSQIFRIIQDAATAGVAVLIASSEYEDLAHLCDRVIVLNRGQVTAELSGDDLTEHNIVRSCLVAG
jgi:ribose transport system ATP-binding protein